MNYLDQASLVALQGLIANPAFMTAVNAQYPDKPQTQRNVLVGTAFDIAEAMDKERKDRGHDD